MNSVAPPIPIPRAVGKPNGSAADNPWAEDPAFRQAFEHLTIALPEAAQLQVDAMQAELDSLKDELTVLRRRDAALNSYMGRLDQELRLAARLQQDFLPRVLPQLGRIHFHTLFRPAGYVSGDLYDIMRLDETHLGVFIVDAVGHGMPAALLTMFIKRALQTKEILHDGYRLLPPGQTMARLNDALVEQNLSDSTFATALYAVIDTATLQITFCSGGHPSPLLLRDGQFIRGNALGSLLGIFPGESYTSSSLQLRSGDRVFIYSDGVEVAFSADLRSDLEQWKKELMGRAHLPTEGLLLDFAELMDRECGSLQPKDDLTMVVVEIK